MTPWTPVIVTYSRRPSRIQPAIRSTAMGRSMALTRTPSTSTETSEVVSGDGIPRAPRGHLIVDPGIRTLEAGFERGRRLPAQPLPDERVVAVAPPHALGRRQVV